MDVKWMKFETTRLASYSIWKMSQDEGARIKKPEISVTAAAAAYFQLEHAHKIESDRSVVYTF